MPETKQGTCPWCERHDQTLFFTVGQHDGSLWYDWICGECLKVARGVVSADAR